MRLLVLSILVVSSLILTSCSTPLSTSESPTLPLVSSPLIESENNLAGTCTRGWSCTSPRCGDWVDEDNDGHCDRGAE